MNVRFGIQIEPQFGFSYEEIKNIAQDAEAAGFHSLWVSDHFFLDERSEERNCLECWTTLSALARETRTLRLGPLVTCTSYRQPSLLAKIAASVDHLSGGRLELGLGAGWKQIEYRAYGFPFPSAGERVARLEEAVQIIQAMWTQARASFTGKYYRIQEALCAPKPVQKPHPPIWIGGSKPRVLEIAARHADGINFIPFPTPAQYAEKLAQLEAACARVGRDFDTLHKSHFTQCFVAETKAQVEALLEETAQQRGRTIEELRAALAPAFVGTPARCAEQIQAYVDLGVSQFMLMFPYGREREMLALCAEGVLPRFG